ncbi:uncharacterized protein K02A2.6-like [Saccostrea cucullata]|uniref:uncharacterized protein K02A2.6-like n=1 Tax=Saccostrea cuccullata TaxID=36930 RepID=UPI002ED65552
MQKEQPVAYASRALNTAERNYAQIEKEMLGIVYGLQKFNEYVYGKTVLVETDHKPLESLFKKPLSSAPPRLQRMMLKVQQHDLVVKYKAGKELYIADTLSRSTGSDPAEEQEEQYEVHVIETIPVSQEKVMLFQSETKKDPVLMKLKDTVLQGWPTNRKDLDSELTPYWNFRDEISIVDGLLLKGDRIITPEQLRPQMLKILHSSHLGQEKCIQRAKSTLFGPGIIMQLKDMIEQCNICNRYRNAQQKEPMIPHDIPNRPWQKVAADIMFFGNARYLITVDYFSKFIEINRLQDGKAATVIDILKQHFARLGIPEEFISDNGPEFANHEFKNFSKEYDFRHITSSPRYPQSNGMAERAVQTIKNLFRKAQDDHKDPYIALMELRNSEIPGVKLSPAQLLFGRTTRTLVPTVKSKLRPMGFNSELVREELQNIKDAQKSLYDRNSKPLKPLDNGDVVRVRIPGQSIKTPGRIVRPAETPRSYFVQQGNTTVRRNRRDLIKTKELSTEQPVDTEESVNGHCDSFCDNSNRVNGPSINSGDETTSVTTSSGRVIKAPRRLVTEC